MRAAVLVGLVGLWIGSTTALVVPTEDRGIPSRPARLTLRGGARPPEASAPAPPKAGFIARRYNKFVRNTFQSVDTNKDGKVDVHEAYALVLELYVKLNRQAPIEPPSREVVESMFKAAGTDKDGFLTKDEFCTFATRMCAAAFFRVAAHKLITIAGGPLFAAWIARKISGKISCETYCKDERGSEVSGLKLLLLSNVKLILTIFFVVSLGNVCLKVLDFLLGHVKRRKPSPAPGKK